MVYTYICTYVACAPPTHFFKGRCYDMCPIQTYVLSHAERIDDLRSGEIDQSKNVQDDEELQSIDRKKRSAYFYHNVDKFADNGPREFHSAVENRLTCEPCDASCLHCFGPLSSQCSGCSFGKQLKRTVHTNESYCINFAERSSGNAAPNSSTPNIHTNNAFLLTIAVSLSIIMTVVIFLIVMKNRHNSTKIVRKRAVNDSNSTYAYDRVALFAEEDTQDEPVDVLHVAPPAIKIDDENNDQSEIIDN